MPGRSPGNTAYPYRHNGQERNNSIFEGALSAENWMYDSRTLRRWEMDPMGYEWQSPYNCFNSNPIYFSDPNGLYGDPPGVATRKVVPKTVPKTFGQIVAEVLEKELNTVVKASIWTTERVLFAVGSFLSPANSGYTGPGSDNGGSEVIGTILDPSFKPMEKITLDPSTLTSQYLLDVKARVEMGKGSFNDHQIYNKTFAPAPQGPVNIQSHHVIPVSVFTDVNNPLFALASQDPDFQEWMDDKGGINRLPLGGDVHTKHTAFSKHVKNTSTELYNQLKPTTPEQAAEITKELIGKLKGEIREKLLANPGKTLNQIYGGGPKGQSKAQSKGRWRGKDSTMGTHDGK